MRNALTTLAVLACATAAVAQTTVESVEKVEKKAAERPSCFVMGSPIVFNVKADTADGPVYFCCAGCIAPFEKDPAKFTEQVAAQRAAVAKLPRVQTACPISGQPLGKDAPSVDHKGQKVSFCCDGCKGKFSADAGKYEAKLADAYTFQTKCPISGNPIDPSANVELVNGAKIYACCGDCVTKIAASPSSFAKPLKAQGYAYKKDELKAKEAPKGD